MPPALDITGHRYGRLSVIGRAGRHRGRSTWDCRCDCGGAVVAVIDSLRAGHTRSCGCLCAENARKCGALSDGTANRTHGLSKTPEYAIWKTMRQRATGHGSPKDRELYQGITCCAEWADFARFIADMGPRPSPGHSLDRIDSRGNYEPGNCRWATATQQANNRRPRRNRITPPSGGYPAHNPAGSSAISR